uniref:TraB/GumN family protein n=1 Tax=Altererythrobacter segetis TaxID=1104773 RepID=UPI001409B867|nr:TraB/GumN family protein [Altererythrobacter segetis]
MPPFRRFIAALVALAMPACAPVDARPAHAAAAYQGPAIWKVADKDTTIYLFGTVHALPKDTKWFSGPVERAYKASDELVTEIPMDASGDAQAIAARALLAKGQSLRAMMAPDDRMKFEEALVGLGLPIEAMDRFEPWYAAMTLSLLPVIKSGYDPQTGAETKLTAEAEGKRKAALETVQQQIDLFDGLPVEAQLSFLKETVDSISKATTTLDAMVAEWMKGDADALAMLLNDELDDPVLYKRLLTDRNTHWAQWIDQRMKQPGTVFVAVGAGHLAGRDSVQAQLRKRGIKARRVWE